MESCSHFRRDLRRRASCPDDRLNHPKKSVSTKFTT
jgi:hypothetical protein